MLNVKSQNKTHTLLEESKLLSYIKRKVVSVC